MSHSHILNPDHRREALGPSLGPSGWMPPLAFDAHGTTSRTHVDKARYAPPISTKRRYGVLVNESAGRLPSIGKAKLARLLKKASVDLDPHIIYCDGASLARNAREMAQSGVDGVLVYGGDGSARSVIEALQGFNVPVLPLPGGTLNRLCHRVHGHAHLEPTLNSLAQARPLWLSGGRANGHLFLVASGFGPWMAFEQVRETARHCGLAAGLKALRTARHKLFYGQLRMQGLAGDNDTVVAAPGHVDRAFGLGMQGDHGTLDMGLEVAAARLKGPFSAMGLGVNILANSWRALENVKLMTGHEIGISHQTIPGSISSGSRICGLVDGEVFEFVGNVRLTYHPRAALVLTSR